MGLSGCDEGLDGLQCGQGGCRGSGGSIPLRDQGEELVEVEAEGLACGGRGRSARHPLRRVPSWRWTWRLRGAAWSWRAGGSSCPWPQCTWPCGRRRPQGRRRGRRVRTACPGISGLVQLGKASPSLTGAVRPAAVAGDGGEAETRVVKRWGERGRRRGRGHRGLQEGHSPAGTRGGRLR